MSENDNWALLENIWTLLLSPVKYIFLIEEIGKKRKKYLKKQKREKKEKETQIPREVKDLCSVILYRTKKTT